jgi:hypothetical protein
MIYKIVSRKKGKFYLPLNFKIYYSIISPPCAKIASFAELEKASIHSNFNFFSKLPFHKILTAEFTSLIRFFSANFSLVTVVPALKSFKADKFTTV